MGDLVSLPKTGSKVSLKSWWTFLRVVLVLLITLDPIDGQLIGSRGVFTLPEGMEYRDALTRDASKYDRSNFTFLIPSPFFRMAADFAMHFQVKEDKRVKEKYKKKSKAEAKKHSPFFGPKPLVKGRPLLPNEVLDFRDSRFLNPPEELRMNKILPEVEMERTTSSVRLLMDDMLNPLNIAKNPLNIAKNPPKIAKDIRPPPKQFPTFEAVRTGPQDVMPKQFASFDAVRPKPDLLDASRINKDARMQFPTFEAVPTVQPSKQRKMGLKKGGRMKKQRFMGVKARKNKQQAARKPQSFQRFMPMQVMDNQSRKETTSPEALQTIFPIENEVTRSRSKPLMGPKMRPPQRTFEQTISRGRNPRPFAAPSRSDKGEMSHIDPQPVAQHPSLEETRIGFPRGTQPGPRPFMSPPPRTRMGSRHFGAVAQSAKPNGFRQSLRPPLNSVNPIDVGGGGRPFIQSPSPQLHQNLGPLPSGLRSGDEFGLAPNPSPPQSHQGANSVLGLDLLKLPPPPLLAERPRNGQSLRNPRPKPLPTPQAARPLPLRQFGDREVVTEVESLKREPPKPFAPRQPTAQPIFQVFAQQRQPIQDLATNSLDDRNLISSSSPAPPVSFKLARLKGRARKGPKKLARPKLPLPPPPIRVSSPRPRVFDRTPSSLTDINSNEVSSNVFGRKSMGSFLVQGPNYSISWGR